MATCGAVVNHLQVCYDVVAADAGGFTVRFYVNTIAWGWADDQILTIDGSNGVHWSGGYRASASSGQTKELFRVDIGFPVGPGGTVAFGAVVSDVSGGGNPRVDGSYTTACVLPSAPGTGVDTITSDSARIVVSASASNGGCAITQYQAFVLSNNAWPDSGGNIVASGYAGTFTATGLARATTYYYTARAVTSAGYGPWTTMKAFTTLPTIPSAPGTPVITGVTPTSATASYTAPSDNGGQTVTSYQVQYATDAAFTTDVVTQANGILANLTPGVTYYVRVRAVNASGAGPWSGVSTFTTLTGMKVYNGTAWVDSPVYNWDGANWDADEIRIYNGTAWVPTG